MLQNLLYIGIGGFIGATLRYSTFILLQHFHPHTIPLGTLVVNIIGSFVVGIFLAFVLHAGMEKPNSFLYLFFVTGICGAFTTFSAFSEENLVLLLGKNYLGFSLNVLSNVALCLIATFVGYLLIVKFMNS